MKRSYKPEIFKGVFIVTTLVLLILFYVTIKLRIDFMFKEIGEINAVKGQLKNKQIKLKVELQELASEHRIRTIAIEDLGMVKRSEPDKIIYIDSELIKDIKENTESENE